MKINERLWCVKKRESSHIWVGNIKVPNVREWTLDEYKDFINISINQKMIQEETKQFCEFFFKELSLLEELYRPNNVEVKWGFIKW